MLVLVRRAILCRLASRLAMFLRTLIAALALVGCTPTNPDEGLPAFVFGAVTDRTGSLATPSWQDAFQLAVDDTNEALRSGNATFRVRVDMADSENLPLTAVARAAALAVNRPEAERVKALITDSSANSIATHQLQYGIMGATPGPAMNVPIVCIACTSPAINNPAGANDAAKNKDKWLYRTVMSATLQAQVLVQTALNGAKPGVIKVGVYASDDAFGQGFSTAIKNAAIAERMRAGQPAPIIEQIYHPASADANSYNWNADMAKMIDDATSVTAMGMTTTTRDQVPDVIMEVTFPQYTAAIMNAYRDSGSNVRFLHTHTFRFVSVLQTLANLVEGQEGTSHVVLDTSASADTFRTRFTNATRVAPSFWDANSYDAAMVIILAGFVAGRGDLTNVTAVQVRDALAQISDPSGVVIGVGPAEVTKAIATLKAGMPINYQGASGNVDFDGLGNVNNKVAYWRVTNNKFEDLRVHDCEASAMCPVINR